MLKHLSIITLFVSFGLAGCTSTGLPSAAAPASGSSTQSLAGDVQLGVTGDGGVLQTAGLDVVTPLLGDSGLLGATLAGGSDGVLGSAVSGAGAAGVIPADLQTTLDGALTQVAGSVPSLGVSGSGSLGEDLLGYDVVGGLIGTDGGLVPTLLSGGETGPLGGALPDGSAPLQPVGDLLAGVVEGAQTGEGAGSINALAPVLQPILLSALGASSGTGGPLPDLPLPALPLDQLQPVLVPTISLLNQLTTTPLPGGQTAGDVVYPLVFGTVLGVVGNTLPLDAVTSGLTTQLP